MKKVLNILSIISLITIGASNVVSCSNKEIKEQKISFNHNIKTINGSFSNENRLYFGTDNGAYVLENDSNIAKKINDIDSTITIINADGENNIYFGTNNGAFVLKQGSTIPAKIGGISDSVNAIAIDSNNNVYFGADNGVFVLKQGSDIVISVGGITGEIRTIEIDSADNVYFAGNIVWKILNADINNVILISGFSGYFDVYAMKIDQNDDVYFSGVFTDTILYKLENNSKKVTPVIYQNNNKMLAFENVVSNLVIINNYIYVLEGDIFTVYDNKEKQYSDIKGYNKTEIARSAVYYHNNVYFGTSQNMYNLQLNTQKATKLKGITGDINNLTTFKGNLFYSKNKDEIYKLFSYHKTTNLYWIWIILGLIILLIIIILVVIKFKSKKDDLTNL